MFAAFFLCANIALNKVGNYRNFFLRLHISRSFCLATSRNDFFCVRCLMTFDMSNKAALKRSFCRHWRVLSASETYTESSQEAITSHFSRAISLSWREFDVICVKSFGDIFIVPSPLRLWYSWTFLLTVRELHKMWFDYKNELVKSAN